MERNLKQDVYDILAVSEKPLTARDVEKRLSYSVKDTMAISMQLGRLASGGVVRKTGRGEEGTLWAAVDLDDMIQSNQSTQPVENPPLKFEESEPSLSAMEAVAPPLESEPKKESEPEPESLDVPIQKQDAMAHTVPQAVLEEKPKSQEGHTDVTYDPSRPVLFTDGIPKKSGMYRRWVACRRNGGPNWNRYWERIRQGYVPVKASEVKMSWQHPAEPLDNTVEIPNDSLLMERPQEMQDKYRAHCDKKTEQQNKMVKQWMYNKNRSPEGREIARETGLSPGYWSKIKIKHGEE